MKIKKKELITVIIIAAVLAAILFGAIFLTSRRGKSSDGKPINLYRPIWQEKIIYDHSGVYVVDSQNSTITDLPIDLSAFGINDFRKETLMAGNVDGINLYLSYSYYTGLSESKDMFFRYNLITSEISEIKFTTAFEMNSNNNFYAHGGYLYYFGMNFSDYLNAIVNNDPSYLCRVPVTGGEEEVLAEYRNYNERIVLVDGDTVITSDESSLYAFDVSKKKRTEIFNAKNNGFRLIETERSYYYDGNLYFLAEKDLPSVVEADEDFKESWKTPDDYLISLDIKKKEWKKVIDVPVSLFCVTEDGIFYVKKKYRLLQKTDFALSVNDVLTVYGDSSICSQPIGGGDERVLYTNEKISFNEIFTVKDGKFCGRINSPTETEYDYKVKFAVIDLSSKNIVQFDIPEPTIPDEG